jgi:hypothetical protein
MGGGVLGACVPGHGGKSTMTKLDDDLGVISFERETIEA